eukprot:GHVT01037444.1.p1 GENE.GHVT01037444.1~~GHVT01037444.1.p1  ORF type:complete len:211 (+),score=5.45 GHVT01037444.1:526-1158(+)
MSRFVAKYQKSNSYWTDGTHHRASGNHLIFHELGAIPSRLISARDVFALKRKYSEDFNRPAGVCGPVSHITPTVTVVKAESIPQTVPAELPTLSAASSDMLTEPPHRDCKASLPDTAQPKRRQVRVKNVLHESQGNSSTVSSTTTDNAKVAISQLMSCGPAIPVSLKVLQVSCTLTTRVSIVSLRKAHAKMCPPLPLLKKSLEPSKKFQK